MPQNVTEVFRMSVQSLGLVLKARADINGKQEAYRHRLSEDEQAVDNAKRSEHSYNVEYSANIDCKFDFGNNNIKEFVAGGDPVEAPPVFFETRYFFRGDFSPISGQKVKDVYVEHRMASIADAFNYDEGTLVGTLDFINEPGRFQLDLRILFEDNTEKTVRLEFWVVSVKMNVARDYTKIIEKINNEKPNIVRAFLSKTFWGAALDRDGEADEKSWYEILINVFDYYATACRRIINNPHQRYETAIEWRRADRVKRWIPALTHYYNRLDDDKRSHELFRIERLSAETDTPENQFVLHTLKELQRRLTEFAERLKDNTEVSQIWKDGIIERANQLERLSHHPFFRGVSRFEGFRQQSLVLQKSPGYAQILTAWLKLKSALKPSGDDIDVGYRPISTLYEFWCFLTIRDILKKQFGEPINQEWRDDSPDDILETQEPTDDDPGNGQLCKIDVTFTKDEKTYLLSYQKTYSVKEGLDGETIAGLNPQRPDIVLSIMNGTSVFTYLFDAKYRIWTKNKNGYEIDASPRAAIDDMHRYRDAILYRLQQNKIKHEVIGAYVLYPGRPEPHLYKEYDNSIHTENIGAIPLLPGHLDKLQKWIEYILKKQDAHDHLDSVISTRGTSLVIGNASPEYVIVGYCKSDEHLRWIEKGNYNLRIGEKKGSIIASLQLLSAKYVLIHMEGELQKSDKLYIIEPNSGHFLSRDGLIRKDDYPKENDKEEATKQNDHYLVISIKPVPPDHFLYKKAFNVSKLEGCGMGRQSSIPFVTTVEDLQKNIVI